MDDSALRVPPARVGADIDTIDTPALLVDLDAFERNLEALERSLVGRTVRVRPHAKAHKCPEIARRQVARGAVGICCQKVSEAEVFVRHGIADVLVANEIVGAAKLARLARLAGRATIGVCVDDEGNVEDLARAASDAGTTVHVLVEVDVGANRCGVPPGPRALDLARRVAASRHLRFAGLQAYHGSAQHLRTPEERRAAIGRRARRRARHAGAARVGRPAGRDGHRGGDGHRTSWRPRAACTPSCSRARTCSWTPTTAGTSTPPAGP